MALYSLRTPTPSWTSYSKKTATPSRATPCDQCPVLHGNPRLRRQAEGIVMDVAETTSLPVSAKRRLAALQEEVETIRGDVNARLSSIELELNSYVNCSQLLSCQLSSVERPAVEIQRVEAVPQMEHLGASLQDLQDRLQRLELLLFCIPVANFKEIDNAIQSFMQSNSGQRSIAHSAPSSDVATRLDSIGYERASCRSRVLGVAKTSISPRPAIEPAKSQDDRSAGITSCAETPLADGPGEFAFQTSGDEAQRACSPITLTGKPSGVHSRIRAEASNANGRGHSSCSIQDAFTSMLQEESESQGEAAAESSSGIQADVFASMLNDLKGLEEAEERLRMLKASGKSMVWTRTLPRHYTRCEPSAKDVVAARMSRSQISAAS